ncbi:TIM barrel protein [Sphingomonas paeninsulae]|nr:TIM barrel protein [Sphingomonas paeninsulae]
MKSGRAMRYAPNIGLNSLDTPLFLESVGSIDPIEQIAFIDDHGFAGIEDNFLKLRAPADQARIGAELARRGLEMGCFVNNVESWNLGRWSSRDPDEQTALQGELELSIETAKRANAKLMTTLIGRNDRESPAFQQAALIDNLKRVAPLAERAGVIICLEAVNARDYPMLLLSDVADAYAVALAVGSPAVRILLDIFHVQARGGDVIDTLTRCWDMVAAVQVADNPGRAEMGSGELNWVNVLRHIRSLGYTGLIELEHEVAMPGIAGEHLMLERLEAIDRAI